jgi:hypothetical protein
MIKITIRNAIELRDALLLLSSPKQESIKIDGKDTLINKYFECSGNVRWNLACNLKRVKDIVNIFETERQQIVSKFANENGEVSKDKIHPCNKEIEELLNQESDIDLLKIKIEDMNLDKNQIDVNVLSNLSLIIL